MKRENVFATDFRTRLLLAYGSQCVTHKMHGSQFSSGLPDLFIQHVTFGAQWVELKAIDGETMPNGVVFDWTKQPTPLQYNTMNALYTAGGRCKVLLYVHPWKVCYRFDWFEVQRFRLAGARWTKDEFPKDAVAVEWQGRKTSEKALSFLLV